jgi:hypothetical protein
MHRKGVPASEIQAVLKEVLIEQFGAKPRT